jgi:hypothetical protein
MPSSKFEHGARREEKALDPPINADKRGWPGKKSMVPVTVDKIRGYRIVVDPSAFIGVYRRIQRISHPPAARPA